MRNTIRIVLAVFLIVLVGANYNSVRIVRLAVGVLNDDLKQRTNLILRELAVKLTDNYASMGENRFQFEQQIRRWMDLYNVQGIFLFSSAGQPETVLMNQTPQHLLSSASNLQVHKNLIRDKYLLTAGQFVGGTEARKVVLVFDIGNYLRFERSAKVMSYSGLLLMILAGLAVL